MKFVKWHGLGNDFVVIDLPKNGKYADYKDIAAHLCDRRLGIGADGVVTLRHLTDNAYEMHIFNSDGSEPGMCGNASRCSGLHIKRHHQPKLDEFALHTPSGVVRTRIMGNDTVEVDMGEYRLLREQIPVSGDPKSEARELELTADDKKFTAFCVSMGNPHAVIFVPSINDIELEKWGSELEYAPQFPEKSNIEFVEVISPQLVRMRVWERGCGVTPACGTGSCATATAGFLSGRTGNKVTVLLDGGELQIVCDGENRHVYMTGPATEVFHGEYIERSAKHGSHK